MLSVAILRSQVGCKHPAGQAAVPSVLASTSHVGVDAAFHTQAVPEQSAASHVVWSVEVLSEHDATTCVAVPVHEAVPVHDATSARVPRCAEQPAHFLPAVVRESIWEKNSLGKPLVWWFDRRKQGNELEMK